MIGDFVLQPFEPELNWTLVRGASICGMGIDVWCSNPKSFEVERQRSHHHWDLKVFKNSGAGAWPCNNAELGYWGLYKKLLFFPYFCLNIY